MQFQFRTKARQGRESESLRDIWSRRGRRSSNVDNRQRRGRKSGDLWLGVGLHLNQYGYGLDTCVTHSRYGEYPADMGEGKMKNEKWDLDLQTEAEAENESRLEIDLREIKAFNSVGPINDGKFSRCQGFGYVSDTGTMAKLPYPCNIGKHYSNIGILF